MHVEVSIVHSTDGTPLFVRHYASDSDDAPTLVILHGMSEHGGRYAHVAGWFAERGWRVVVGDLRGHGRSGGTRTHVARFDQYIADLDVLRQHFELDAHRTVLLGHSMGALAAIRYAQAFPEGAAALVLFSPLLGISVRIPATTIAAGRVLSAVAPRFRFQSRIDPADTTRSQDVLRRRERDELMVRSVTARWYFAMRAAMRQAWRDAESIRLPVLVLQAGADRIVCPQAPRLWLEQTASTDRTFRLLDGRFHELHNEPDWPETLDLVADWLSARLARADRLVAGRS